MQTKFNFVLRIVTLLREHGMGKPQPNEQNFLQRRMIETYREHQSEFQKMIEAGEANRTLIDFTSDAAFLRRLKLHKEYINTSQTKKS